MADYLPLYQNGSAAGGAGDEHARFELTVNYTFQDLLTLNRLAGKTTRKWPTRFNRIFSAAMGILLFLFGILSWGEEFTSFTLFSLLMGLFFIGLSLGYHHLNASKSRRMMIKTSVPGSIAFGGQGFTERTNLGTSFRPYAAVYALYHFQSRFFIFLDKKHGYILPEKDFSLGLPAEFGSFLEERCNKKIIYIR